jgi:acyl dehydratase
MSAGYKPGRLEGRVALITGAGSGLGLASAALFASEGARVLIADLDIEAAETAAKKPGRAAAAIWCDVSDASQVKAVVSAACDQFGGLNLMFKQRGNGHQLPNRGPLRADEGESRMTTTTTTLSELPALKGSELGSSDWIEVTQGRVNLFADATGDHQWIHVDAERAKAESPFGGPIAHGYLTLSLLIPMWSQVLTVTDSAMAVNYGLNKVRFPAPVPVGSKVRLTATLADVEEIKRGYQVTVSAVIKRENSDKPVCIAEPVLRFYR